MLCPTGSRAFSKHVLSNRSESLLETCFVQQAGEPSKNMFCPAGWRVFSKHVLSNRLESLLEACFVQQAEKPYENMICPRAVLKIFCPRGCSVQSLDQLSHWLTGGTWQTIQQRLSSSLSYRGPWWAFLAWMGMSIFWSCPSRIPSADHGIIHPPRCPEGQLHRGCYGVSHAWNMKVSVFLTVTRRGSYWPTRKLILLRP